METYQRQDRVAMTCPWCGKQSIIIDNAKAIYTAPHMDAEMNGERLHMATLTTYSECKACGLLFVNPRLSDEWYDWFYSSGTYRQTLGISQEEMDADEQRRADDLVDWLSVFDEMNFKYHIDVGSSRGFFTIGTYNKFGCMSIGIDINKKYQNGQIKDPENLGSPDLVSAIHVLEHVTDPIKELTTWASMTSKYLLIEVPGLNTTGGPLRFTHLYYFPPELLKAKMIELGFDIVAMETEPNTRILAEKHLTR
jgi:hypothetical protein